MRLKEDLKEVNGYAEINLLKKMLSSLLNSRSKSLMSAPIHVLSLGTVLSADLIVLSVNHGNQ